MTTRLSRSREDNVTTMQPEPTRITRDREHVLRQELASSKLCGESESRCSPRHILRWWKSPSSELSQGNMDEVFFRPAIAYRDRQSSSRGETTFVLFSRLKCCRMVIYMPLPRRYYRQAPMRCYQRIAKLRELRPISESRCWHPARMASSQWIVRISRETCRQDS